MWILNWYVSKNFFVSFLMAILVLTFGMTGAQLMKVIDYLSRGVPVSAAFEFLLYTIPMALAFTIPWAALVSIMLVFGRMSADNEITAMRACGISILQIISPIIVTCFLLTCLCLYLQLEVGPRALGNARSLIKEVAANHPLALFTPGVPVDVDQLRILIDGKDDQGNISGIQIYVIDKKTGEIKQDVTAMKGRIQTDKERQVLDIILNDATIASSEGGEISKDVHAFTRESRFSIEYGREANRQDVAAKSKYLTFRELYARAALEKRAGRPTVDLEVEVNQRVALALAPLAFLLLGMPLAIRTSRRETSIGLFLSILLAGAYYGGVLTSDALRDHEKFFPQYIVWIPPAVFQIFGFVYLMKIARK